MSGVWSSHHSEEGSTDDDEPMRSARAMEDELISIRSRVRIETSPEGLRKLCAMHESLVRRCLEENRELHQDFKTVEADLLERDAIILRLEAELAEKVAQQEGFERSVREWKGKYTTAMEQVEYLEQQLQASGGHMRQELALNDIESLPTDGEDYEYRKGKVDDALQLKLKLDQANQKNAGLIGELADLRSHVQELRLQLQENAKPQDQAHVSINSAFDLGALRQELEDIVTRGMTPQLNVHVHQHDHQHVHNHEHQHFYGVKDPTSGSAVPTTVTMSVSDQPQQVKVSMTTPLVR